MGVGKGVFCGEGVDMRYEVGEKDWERVLAIKIKHAYNGDVIVVPNDKIKKWGKYAKTRICPDKRITFEVNKSHPWQRRNVALIGRK